LEPRIQQFFGFSDNQHCIAIGIKTVLLLDCVSVSGKDIVEARESRHESKKRGFGQMKISYHRVSYLELITGPDEKCGFAVSGFDS